MKPRGHTEAPRNRLLVSEMSKSNMAIDRIPNVTAEHKDGTNQPFTGLKGVQLCVLCVCVCARANEFGAAVP